MDSVGRLFRACRARLHKGLGLLAYRLGWRQVARAQFERVLLHGGADFVSYIYLGRIAFDSGDYAGWRREFEHARRLDPVRFARLRHTIERSSPRLAGTSFRRDLDGQGFDETGDRATWRSLRPFPGSAKQDLTKRPDLIVESTLDAMRSDAGMTSAGETEGAPVQDDCSSDAERKRLAALGPIAATELKRCNVDELARRLSS
jgi:hypothetical protein